MNILIINLDGQTERLAFQNAQMKRLGLEYERLRACQVDDLQENDIARQASQWERPMRKTEVACLASHRAAWQFVIDANAPVLILEDDALLSDKTPQILADLENFTDLDHVSLETRSRKKLLGKFPKYLASGTNMLRLYQDRTGAAAYVLWPRGAKILLENSDRAAGLADAIIAAAYQMSSWQIVPAAALQMDQARSYGLVPPIETDTTIATSTHKKPRAQNMLAAAKFKFRRVIAQLRMGIRQLSVFNKANRRFVAVETADFQAHIHTNKQD